MKKKEDNILIVDDISKNIQVLGSILQKEGYAISYAMDGRQALLLINSEKFDLVLLDVMMPEMDGYEVCRRLKQTPNGVDLPVIFLTAKTEKEDIVKGFEVGAVDYISKPFNKAELLARVRTHLFLKRSMMLIEEQNSDLQNKNEQLQQLSQNLAAALKQIKTLEGFLPICSHCHKIREKDADPDQDRSWVSLEAYIDQHTDAALSHSICPTCMKKHYSEYLSE